MAEANDFGEILKAAWGFNYTASVSEVRKELVWSAGNATPPVAQIEAWLIDHSFELTGQCFRMGQSGLLFRESKGHWNKQPYTVFVPETDDSFNEDGVIYIQAALA